MERKSGTKAARGKGSEHNSARYYVSTVNTKPEHSRNNIYGTHTEDELKRMNIKVIEKLLADFDLNGTTQKHLSKNIVEFVMDPNDYGSDSSLITTRIRQRLQKLMGTDVIRLNDKKYFDELSKKIREEYQADMTRKERVLAEAEEERVRRLVLEGIIPIPDDIGIEHNPYNYTKRKKRKPEEYKHSHLNRKKTQESSVDLPRRLPSPAHRSPTPTKKMDEDVVTQVQMMGASRKKVSTHKSSTNKQEKSTSNSSKSDTMPHSTSPLQKHSGSYHAVEILEYSEDEHTDSGSQSVNVEKKRNNTKIRPRLVEELREQETVDGLYDVAARLVS